MWWHEKSSIWIVMSEGQSNCFSVSGWQLIPTMVKSGLDGVGFDFQFEDASFDTNNSFSI